MIHGQPVQQPPTIPPGPLPTSVAVGQAQVPNLGNMVVFDAFTPQGNTRLFFDLKAAELIAKAILRVVAAGQLSLAPPSGLGPNR